MDINLTQKQQEFFDKLQLLYQNRALASYEKIKKELGYKSKNSIKQYVEALKKENFILNIDDNLYINPDKFGAKLVSSYVKAGFASIMDDKIEKRISMDDILNINSPSTYVFKVSGDSMCEVGILDGDYVIIKKIHTKEKKLDLVATLDANAAYCDADFVIVAAPTNYDSQKNFFDTSTVEDIIEKVISMKIETTMVVKSTIPVGYTESVRE